MHPSRNQSPVVRAGKKRSASNDSKIATAPTYSETANVAPTDCSAADLAASGNLNGASNLTICGLYVVAKMLPMIAPLRLRVIRSSNLKI